MASGPMLGPSSEEVRTVAPGACVHTAIRMYLEVLANKEQGPDSNIYNRSSCARMHHYLESTSGNAAPRISAEDARAFLREESGWEASVTIAVAWAFSDKIALRYKDDD